MNCLSREFASVIGATVRFIIMKLCTTILSACIILIVYIYSGTARSISLESINNIGDEEKELLANSAVRAPRARNRTNGRQGYIYVLREFEQAHNRFTNYYKVGLSVNPIRRRKNLQTGNPRRLQFACRIYRVRDRFAAETNAKLQLRGAISKSNDIPNNYYYA